MSPETSSSEDRLWAAVAGRDRLQDGRFVYGVLTTGVYCRPGCPSRLPKRTNVRFYPTPQDAERAGFRPCRRCRPTGAAEPGLEARMRRLCGYIESHAEEPLTLSSLGRVVALSPAHLQRQFKKVVGVTPKEYQDGVRMRELKQALQRDSSTSVTGAIFEAGFGSLSRVYEKSDARLGMTPRRYRSGGAGLDISFAFSHTPVGLMLVAATDRGLCSVQFGSSEAALSRALRSEYPHARLCRMPSTGSATFSAWMERLNEYLQGRQPAVDLPLDIRATAFQLIVWRYLRTIPRGHVATYGEVAKGVGRPTAVRAVARACATNRVAVAIPCHRVIRSSGDPGGYRWGARRKRALLELEGAVRTA